jgi:hypothetical protein
MNKLPSLPENFKMFCSALFCKNLLLFLILTAVACSNNEKNPETKQIIKNNVQKK